jgi:hypothetical protein
VSGRGRHRRRDGPWVRQAASQTSNSCVIRLLRPQAGGQVQVPEVAQVRGPQAGLLLELGAGEVFRTQFLTDDDQFVPNAELAAGGKAMLDELLRLASALRPLRHAG